MDEIFWLEVWVEFMSGGSDGIGIRFVVMGRDELRWWKVMWGRCNR